ncbi:hypothetical protein NF430_12155, partial [Streptococcus suis]|nr:hypothetical protein [Streptococcus suis]
WDFFLYSKKLHNFHGGFTHYRYYRAVKRKGWAKSPAPLLKVSVNISAQWLIGFNSPVDC